MTAYRRHTFEPKQYECSGCAGDEPQPDSKFYFDSLPTPTSTPTPTPASSAVVSGFGLVHSNAGDLTMARQGFVKNWWDLEGGASALASAAASDMANGQIETPMIKGNWDNANPATLQTTMTQFFQANPKLPTWEFGLEENINGLCCSTAQLATIHAKLQAVQAAKVAAGHPEMQVAYQIVEDPAAMQTSDVAAFLASGDAARHGARDRPDGQECGLGH